MLKKTRVSTVPHGTLKFKNYGGNKLDNYQKRKKKQPNANI